MSKLFNIVKVTGFFSLVALMSVSAMPTTGHAADRSLSKAPRAVYSQAEAQSVARDCDGSSNTCFVRVGDDGSITVYNLGNLLN